MSLAYVMGIGLNPHKTKVELDLVKQILDQSSNLSIADIAKKCNCTTKEVKAVFWDEKIWRQRIANEGASNMNQVDLLKQMYDREKLLNTLTEKTQGALAKEHRVSPSIITALRKDFKITQEDVEQRKADLVPAGSPAEPEPEHLPAQKPTADEEIELYIITHEKEPQVFDISEHNSVDDALYFIKTKFTLLEVDKVRLYKLVPYSYEVKVTAGQGKLTLREVSGIVY